MNTAEMARLIDSVVYDARALGIKTKEDFEIERMVEKWTGNNT